MIKNVISFVEAKTHYPIFAISASVISSPFISSVSAVLGDITVVATCVAAVFTAAIKVREWLRGRKKKH